MKAEGSLGLAFQLWFDRREVSEAWLGGLLAISALRGISAWSHDGRAVAPFGASMVVLFGHRPHPLDHRAGGGGGGGGWVAGGFG